MSDEQLIEKIRKDLDGFEKTRMDAITIECENLVPKYKKQLRELESKTFNFRLNRKFAEFNGYVYNIKDGYVKSIDNKVKHMYFESQDETIRLNYLNDPELINETIETIKGFGIKYEFQGEGLQEKILYLESLIDKINENEDSIPLFHIENILTANIKNFTSYNLSEKAKSILKELAREILKTK